jgi:hypothetical protein
MSGNAKQRRAFKRRVWSDHHRWPLGTPVVIQPGHHSPEAVGLVGKVNKHGSPCTHRVNCIVVFDRPVMDLTFGAARYGHYVDFRRLRRVKATGSPS